MIKSILGLILQSIGLIFCLPGYGLIALGSWIVELGDTLRIEKNE